MIKNRKMIISFTYQLQLEVLYLKQLIEEKLNKKEQTNFHCIGKEGTNENFEIPLKLCPEKNCELNCSKCLFHSDKFFFNNKCLSREISKSIWSNIIICGYNKEKGLFAEIDFDIVGIIDSEHNIYYTPLVSISTQQSTSSPKYVEYLDYRAEYDNYALSVIIEALNRVYEIICA